MKNNQQFTCNWIFNQLVVLCDGKVVCGCADPFGERPLGNVHKEKLSTIWKSDRVKQIRRELNEGYSPFCDPCGLKQKLDENQSVPQQPVDLEILPRAFIEPTVLCNISCFKAVCNHESGIAKSRNESQLSMDMLKDILEDVGNHMIRVDLFNYGDPFVHPLAVDMIEYIKEKFPNIYLYISTNGLMLNDDKIKRIVASGLDEITFSVDGANQESYSRYRIGGDFDKIVKIMSEFVEERNTAGKEIPFINWRYILFNWNDSRQIMNKAKKIAERIGVDRFTWEITDHPPEAKSEKYQIGLPEWKKIYHEIWDSSQIGTALKKKRYVARITPRESKLTVGVNKPGTLKVRIKNTGGALWWKITHSGRRLVRLGAQLHNENKELLNLDYTRGDLNHSIKKNKKDEIELLLPAIKEPGNYWLKFDMVSEGNDWFENGGSPVSWIPFCVQNF